MAQKKKDQTVDKRLTKAFTSTKNPGSFGGVVALWRAVNNDGDKHVISKPRVTKWLSTQRVYNLHKQPKRKFKRRKVIVSGINAQWQADLIDMSKHAKHNKGNTFLLTVIDVFSKKAYAKPLQRKNSESVTNAFRSILSDSGGKKPYTIQVDKGKEFLNATFKKWCSDNGIKLVTSEDDIMKAQIVERFNRTLKNKMYRYFAYKNNVVWYDILEDLVTSYNNSYHRAIKRTPNEVNKETENSVFNTLYPPPTVLPTKAVALGMKVGDGVRLLNPPTVFKKGYAPQWTREVFRIRVITTNTPIPLFKVEDLSGEHIDGHFYRTELQKVAIPKPNAFKVEKIIESKGDKHLVRWVDRGFKDDEWLSSKELKRFQYNV